jgi:hypothetical protein
MKELNIKNLSIPMDKLFTFDDVLSIVSLAETPDHPSSYILAFMRLLIDYRKKCEANEQF